MNASALGASLELYFPRILNGSQLLTLCSQGDLGALRCLDDPNNADVVAFVRHTILRDFNYLNYAARKSEVRAHSCSFVSQGFH